MRLHSQIKINLVLPQMQTTQNTHSTGRWAVVTYAFIGKKWTSGYDMDYTDYI